MIYFPGSGQIEFTEFVILASKFIVEEDEEALQKELKEAFRLYDKEGKSHNTCMQEVIAYKMWSGNQEPEKQQPSIFGSKTKS